MSNKFFEYGGTPATQAARDPVEGGRAILAELSDEDWEKFIGFAARRRYPDGAVIFGIGEKPGALGFIASGAVALRGGADASAVERRGEGDVFGMLGFLDDAACTVQVRAQGGADVLLLTREALLQLAAWQPRIAVALLRDLGAEVASRLRRVQGGD